jgi:hypothetical protein
MPGKRVQFDDETWQAIQALAHQTGKSFQELASMAFAELLKSTINLWASRRSSRRASRRGARLKERRAGVRSRRSQTPSPDAETGMSGAGTGDNAAITSPGEENKGKPPVARIRTMSLHDHSRANRDECRLRACA